MYRVKEESQAHPTALHASLKRSGDEIGLLKFLKMTY